MGEHNVEQFDETASQAFMNALLEDLRALEYMIASGQLESGVTRIGAEQEMFLIDSNFRPAPLSLEVLDLAQDARLTTEIARFNLEANLTPLPLAGRCLQQMEEELKQRHSPFRYPADAAKVRSDARESGTYSTV